MDRGRVGLVLAGLLLAGCNSSGTEREPADRPPDTRITSGPPDSSASTSYQVPLAWFGTDPDGSVDHYDVIVVDHPRGWDSISDVIVRVPAVTDPRWRGTAAVESTLVVSADTLRLDPRGLPPDDVRREFFERWHTFFVRAVDDRGTPDPTPDYRTFNARTLAPTVGLASPVQPGQPFAGGRNLVLHWSGEDPLDKASSEEPVASRWTIVQTHQLPDGSFAGFPDTLYALPPSAWSRWRDWNASDGSGRQATLHSLDPGFYLFAVQAMDAAGAVTPVFDGQTPGKNNATPIVVTGVGGPVLTVWSPAGVHVAVGQSPVFVFDLAAGAPIRFRWHGDASAYGGTVTGYRYGWNITDPEDDRQWEQSWCETCRSTSPTQVFPAGTQRFFLEARDDIGGVTRAQFELRLHGLTRSRELLWIDDSTYPPGDSGESLEDARWRAVLDSLQARRAFDFDPARDVFDVEALRAVPPIALLFDYRTVLWTVRANSSFSALRELGFFVDPFAPHNEVPRPAYLNSYLDNGGRLWMCGEMPAVTAWPVDLQPDPERRFPVAVTNWDDPLEPHPQIDSVGANSFLYRMGIESFDLGAGPRAPRPRGSRLDHACLGFRRATPPPWADAQTWIVPEVLEPDVTWPLPPVDVNPLGGRWNVEIYNMPFLARQQPPLEPSRRSFALYLYTSGVREDPARGIVYPFTADGQPALILAKRVVTSSDFTRVFCGFEPWRLRIESHVALAEFLLLRQLRVGLPDAP